MKHQKDRLIGIQYLRGIAALMVVLHHARNPTDWLFNPLTGYGAFGWGVDIFFVISGFIMYAAARNERPADFLGRRIIRVVPLYWVATLAFVMISTGAGLHIWWIGEEQLLHLLQSLLFIPHYSPDYPGKIYPYLVPGWTLNYEMIFYLIFCAGLLLRRTLTVTSLVIIGLFVAGLWFDPQQAPLKAYTHPIILEFLCGVWIAYAYVNGWLKRSLTALGLAGFAGLLALPFAGNETIETGGRILCSAVIVAGIAALGTRAPSNRVLGVLGDASYSIYLTHTIVSLDWASYIWRQVPLTGWPQFISWMALSLVISAIVGILVYWLVELPMLRLLRAWWKRRTGERSPADRVAGQEAA